MSLFSKIVGALTGAPTEPRTRILSDAVIDAAPGRSDDRAGERRRGRRGGRGRGGSGSASPDAGPARRDDRNDRNEPRGRPSRWSRPARDSLDAPLPEDIAFRPAAEGGDASIVPVRRRPASGSQRPGGRVLYLTTNQYVARDGAVEPLAPGSGEALETGEHAETGDGGDGTEPAKKRRRGRRGGRGRRRPGDAEQTTGDRDGAEDAEAPADLDDYVDDDDVDDADELAGDAAEYATEDDFADEDEVAELEAPPMRRAPVTQVAATPLTELPEAFLALDLGDAPMQAVARLGFAHPTPIQHLAIPVLLAGRDVVGIAQTGTGKTLAFGLPMIERLDASRRVVQAIVLVPTRELAQQVLDVLQDVGAASGLDTVGLLGGRSLDRDFRALERKPHVVVGTPGRIIDHLNRGTLTLESVRYAVLDEADQMLDIGFLPDITRILSRTPRRRQTALFSATMPHAIQRLVYRYMESPETISIAPQGTTVDAIEQIYFEVAQRDKVRGLRELIERELKGRTLVFSRTRRGVDFVADRLSRDGVRVGALHGDMEQRRRDQVVQAFREGNLDVLIATNVAARGLDIPEITHVVNFDVPMNAEEYVHRIGRTGRAGREGKAITFVCENDIGEFDVLLNAFGDRLKKEELYLYG